MTPERWREIERLYHVAHERPPEDRAAFLRDASGGDDELRAIVESLLAPREASEFMEPPPRELAAVAGATLDTSRDRSSDLAESPHSFLRRRPWWVWCCALLAAVAAAGWYWVVLAGPVPVGWELRPVKQPSTAIVLRVHHVQPGTSAARAGLEVNDLVTASAVERFVSHREPYVPYRLEIVRAGEPKSLVLTADRPGPRYWLRRERSARLFRVITSALDFVLAGLLLFSRPRDRSARWGALLVMQFGFIMLLGALGFRLAPEISQAVRALPMPVEILALLGASISFIFPGGAFAFCASFPRPLSLSNRVWWVFVVGVAATIFLDLDWLWLPVFRGPAEDTVARVAIVAGWVVGLIFLAWALSLLAYNYRRVEGLNERRRLRIVAVGFGLTLATSAVGMVILMPWPPIEEIRTRYWDASVWRGAQISLFAAAPICTSYAILRHRVFDIHVMIRLGVRYAAARGVLLSLVPATGVVLLLDVLTHRSENVTEILTQRGLLYLVLGGTGLLLHVKRKVWLDALDRRFFRERYDAYRLLSGVADDVRRSASFDEAARHVIARVNEALHPESVSLMIRQTGEAAYHSAAAINADLPAIPADARVIGLARVLNKPLENAQSGTGWLQQQLPRPERVLLQRARVEWLFPVSLGGPGAEAFLLIGPKRSEEPYSREDRMMLQAIAASLGLVLERPAVSAAGVAECPECGACYDSGFARCESDGQALTPSPHRRLLSGRYRLDRRFGRGGMGTVYAAADTLLERRVAVKVIREEWLASADAVARFRREAKAAASFTHPNVVTVHDFGVSDGRAYLVMELLEGRTLREELRERGSLEPRRTRDILRGVSSAVTKAHERQLLHRDLKPENVFLARSENGEVAKVLDFGLVKPLGSGYTDSLTGGAPGALIGTLAYMSPEQRAGEAAAESWDIWALTAIAVEMLTGVHPVALSGNPRVGLGGADFIGRASARRLSAPTAAFFERALSLDASRRPASVRQWLEELERVL